MHWSLQNRSCLKCYGDCARPRGAKGTPPSLCRDAAKKQRKRSGDKTPLDITISEVPSPLGDGSTVVWPVRDEQRGPTPGALQGNDYQLEYYEDGYPKLPACLDRRRIILAKAA